MKFLKEDTKETEDIKYEKLTDEEIVSLIKDGDDFAQEYLLDKYKPFVKAKARAYFLIGADRDDIIQEGMIGLYKACLLYTSRCV